MISKFLRYMKYTLGAKVLNFLIKNTGHLDGCAEPPSIINFAGGGDYLAIGEKNASNFTRYGELKIDESVLDIGCAIGRNAVGLHKKFGDEIYYHGFDIVSFGIAWCQKYFDKMGSSYQFDAVDVYNSFYNPKGSIAAKEFIFPYKDGKFDLTIATSVYTHMEKQGILRYLSESRRVTKPGGRLYATFFVLDGEAKEAINQGLSLFTFSHFYNGLWVESAQEPDMAVAVDKDELFSVVRGLGVESIDLLPGSWRGSNAENFQDILIAKF